MYLLYLKHYLAVVSIFRLYSFIMISTPSFLFIFDYLLNLIFESISSFIHSFFSTDPLSNYAIVQFSLFIYCALTSSQLSHYPCSYLKVINDLFISNISQYLTFIIVIAYLALIFKTPIQIFSSPLT